MTLPDQKLHDEHDGEHQDADQKESLTVEDLIAYRKELVSVIERSIKAVEEIDKRIDKLEAESD